MKIRRAFVMSVNAGAEQEYEKRHSPIWPELETALKDHDPQNGRVTEPMLMDQVVRLQSVRRIGSGAVT